MSAKIYSLPTGDERWRQGVLDGLKDALRTRGATPAEIAHIAGVVDALPWGRCLDLLGLEPQQVFDRLVERLSDMQLTLIKEVAERELELVRMRRPGPRAA